MGQRYGATLLPVLMELVFNTGGRKGARKGPAGKGEKKLSGSALLGAEPVLPLQKIYYSLEASRLKAVARKSTDNVRKKKYCPSRFHLRGPFPCEGGGGRWFAEETEEAALPGREKQTEESRTPICHGRLPSERQ